MTIHQTSLPGIAPASVPDSSPVAKPTPGEAITLASLAGGRFVAQLDDALSQANALLTGNDNSGTVKVVAQIEIEASGFIRNIKPTVEVKSGKLGRWESKVTATSKNGRLETFDDTTAKQEPKKRGRKKKGEAETTELVSTSPDETAPLTDAGKGNMKRVAAIAKAMTSDEPVSVIVETALDEVPDWNGEPEAAEDQGAQGDLEAEAV